MTITTRYKTGGVKSAPNVHACAGGYANLMDMQNTLTARFKHHRRRKVKNGVVRIEGPWHDRATYLITF